MNTISKNMKFIITTNQDYGSMENKSKQYMVQLKKYFWDKKKEIILWTFPSKCVNTRGIFVLFYWPPMSSVQNCFLFKAESFDHI